MATFAYSKTLVAGTPENINDVQTMFTEVATKINGNLNDDNIASPNNLVPRAVFDVGGCSMSGGGSFPTGTYVLSRAGMSTAGGGLAQNINTWIPNTADFAVAGKTTQFRVVCFLLVNAVAPGVNFTAGLSEVTAITGGAAGTMNFTLAAAAPTVVFTTPGASSSSRGATAWTNLSTLSANPYCLTIANSGSLAATTTVSVTGIMEIRHS